jgi:hypothetical protein
MDDGRSSLFNGEILEELRQRAAKEDIPGNLGANHQQLGNTDRIVS